MLFEWIWIKWTIMWRLPFMSSGTLSRAKWIRTGISGLGMSARLHFILCKWLVTCFLLYSNAISLPLSRACCVNWMQWSVIFDSWSRAIFFSCNVFCLESQTSVSLVTNCLPLTLIVFVNLLKQRLVIFNFKNLCNATYFTTNCVISCTNAFFFSVINDWRSAITFTALLSSTLL